MRLHHGSAVLHFVIFAVVFVVFFWGGGGGVWSMVFTAGLRSVSITKCSRTKICFIQTLHFYRVSNISIMNIKFSTLPLTL